MTGSIVRGVAVLVVTLLVGIGGPVGTADRSGGTVLPSRVRAAVSETLQARALRIHRDAIVLDGHMDSVRSLIRPGWRFTDRHDPGELDENLRAANGHLDLPRM